jgi:hypothetical protein
MNGVETQSKNIWPNDTCLRRRLDSCAWPIHVFTAERVDFFASVALTYNLAVNNIIASLMVPRSDSIGHVDRGS